MRILIADVRPRVRFALRVLLEQQPGLEVVGEVLDVQEWLARVQPNCPDLVLLSWELAGSEASDALSALRAACPGASVIALSGRPEARQAALNAGVEAFVSKTDPPEHLLAAIHALRCAHSQTARRAK